MSFLITAAAAVLVFGSVVFIHEFGHFITAKRAGITVLEFALGMGPKLWSFQRGETLYSLRLLPVGGFCMMEGEEEESESEGSFSRASVWARMRVVAAGAVMNMLLGLLVLSILTATGGLIATTTVHSFVEGASTEASGLMVGDTILKVNGSRLFIADDIYYDMMWDKDGIAEFLVVRGGERITLPAVQFETTPNGDGTNSITIDFIVVGEEPGIFNVVGESVRKTLSLGRQILRSLGQLITGEVPINQLSGPVGIVSVIGEAAGYGLRPLLHLLAYISINLGSMNVMPLPALDGGKLLLLAAEAVTGKKLSEKWEIIINTVGLVLLLGLMVFATVNDIGRLVS